MAVLLGESVQRGEEFIGRLEDKDLLDKLLGNNGKKVEWRTVLKACALFNAFGYKGECSSQLEFIATNKHITSLSMENTVAINQFNEVCSYYLDRQILETKGRYLSVRPYPLAMSLAQEWLAPCTPQRLLSVINDIANLTEPNRTQLANALAEQMKYLGYNEKALDIIDKIVGVGSPFDNAEVLNTELGSRLFRSFVEVNPVAVSQNFIRQFSNKTTKELLEMEDGRRNIVWALEKLCFDRRTFKESAKILFAFSVAENETWGNNATGQLKQLFHIFLSGTEADLRERWSIIEWGLSKNDEQFTKLAIELMRNGLSAGHFHRMGGAEKQGTKQLQDNYPTPLEISEYWDKILTKLTEIIEQDKQYSDLASEIVANSIRQIFHFGFAETIIPYLQKITIITNNNWDKGLENLKMTLHYDKKSISEENIEIIQTLIKSLTKKDFISRFFASTHYEDDDVQWSSDKFMQREQGRMEELAKEFVDANIPWDSTLPILYKRNDDKHLMFKSNFGIKVYEYISSDINKVNLFIDKSLYIFVNINREDIDFSILAGFIENAEQDTKDRFYSLLYQSEQLNYLLFNFVSFDKDGVKQFEKLYDLVDTQKCDLSNFSLFKYRAVLQNLNNEKVKILKEKLFDYGDEGYALVFNLYSSIRKEDDSEINSFTKKSLKECVLKLGVNYPKSRHIDNYGYAKFIADTLNNDDEDEFSEFIINSIIDSISWKNNYHLDHYIQQVCEVLIKKHFKSIWKPLSQALIGENENFVKYWGLKHIFGSHIGGVGRSVSLLLDGDIEEIFKWCHNNKPLAPTRFAGLVPIYDNNNQDFAQWNPIAKRLIDEFGNIQEMLNELSCNMGTFSWTGSLVPLYQAKKKLFESISNHSTPRVSEWAKQNIFYAEKEIENETNRDAEEFL